MTSIILWIIVGALLGVGLIGTLVPALPGLGFVYGGIILYAFATGFAEISVRLLIIFGVLTLLAVGADYAGSAMGAKFGGGKQFALLGTIAGLVLGMALAGPIGLLLGAFIGGLLGAIYEGASSERALKVAVFSVLGIVGAAALQFTLALAMIITFALILIT